MSALDLDQLVTFFMYNQLTFETFVTLQDLNNGENNKKTVTVQLSVISSKMYNVSHSTESSNWY